MKKGNISSYRLATQVLTKVQNPFETKIHVVKFEKFFGSSRPITITRKSGKTTQSWTSQSPLISNLEEMDLTVQVCLKSTGTSYVSIGTQDDLLYNRMFHHLYRLYLLY